MERISKFQGINLYVKNLDDSITDDNLREEFTPFGTITSCRVMRDPKDSRSRGFGFVCYSAPEEAARAVNEMNGKLIIQKPIFVALAQRKDVRRAQLEAQHSSTSHVGVGGPQGGGGGQQGGNMMRGGPMGGGGPMGYPGVMPMYMQRPGGSMQPAYPMMPQMLAAGQQPRPGGGGAQQQQQQPGNRGAAGGYGPMMHQQQQRPVFPMPGYGVVPGQPGRGGANMRGPPPQQQGRGGQQQLQQAGRGGPPGGARAPVAGRGVPMPGRGMTGGSAAGVGIGGPTQLKFNQQARNAGVVSGQQQPSSNMNQPSAGSQPEGALTASALASASPEMQKNMIGERLYPLIHASQPELAGKITGMLLEMDNSELLHLLESPEALNSKINEALLVLEAHNASQVGRE
jgi:polyadenylate-binding protein